MVCTQCGNDNPASNKFCGNCGTRLEAAAPAAVESKSRPVIRPIDLRDPTDPGRIATPADRRSDHATKLESYAQSDNATFASNSLATSGMDSTDPAAPVTGPEPPAYETGTTLDEPLAYKPTETVSADRIPIGETPANMVAVETPERDFVEAPSRRDMSIHGPSLLGLSDDDQPSGPAADYSYLYEDEGTGRGVNWRLLTAVAIVLIFAGVLGLMWSQGKNWNTTIIKAVTGGEQTQKDEAPVVAKSEPTTPGAPEISVQQTQKPIPADQPQSDQNAATGQNNNANATAATPATSTDPKPADANDVGGKTASAATTGSAAKLADRNVSGITSTAAAKPQTKDADTASLQAKNDTNADDAEDVAADDKDAGDAGATTKAAAKAKSKAAAAKQARNADAEEEEDTAALVRRADVLLKARSCNQAVDLLREAALQGNATARSRLGGLYATGHCVPLDRAEAYNWFTLAKDAGARASWIEHNRSMLWASMTDRERSRVMHR